MTYQRIKIGSNVFNLSQIIFASQLLKGEAGIEVTVNLFSDKNHDIDEVILQGEEAQTFWQYCRSWERMVRIQGTLVNIDHITFARPAAEVEGRILIWLTIDWISPFQIEGAEARKFWEAYTRPEDCLDLGKRNEAASQ